MVRSKKVALVGDSLMLEGVAMRLDDRADVQIIRIDPCTDDIQRRLLTLQPDLILLELQAPWTAPLLALLCETPGTEAAVLDFSEQRLVLVSSRHYATQTMDDLLQRIQVGNDGAEGGTDSENDPSAHKSPIKEANTSAQPIKPMS